jgi:hypothetical protein
MHSLRNFTKFIHSPFFKKNTLLLKHKNTLAIRSQKEKIFAKRKIGDWKKK